MAWQKAVSAPQAKSRACCKAAGSAAGLATHQDLVTDPVGAVGVAAGGGVLRGGGEDGGGAVLVVGEGEEGAGDGVEGGVGAVLGVWEGGEAGDGECGISGGVLVNFCCCMIIRSGRAESAVHKTKQR